MPIFDYRCPECGHVDKNVFVKTWNDVMQCPKHDYKEGSPIMEKIPSRFLAAIFPNGGIFLEHVSSEGKTFHSKKEMRQYAKEHDLELGAL